MKFNHLAIASLIAGTFVAAGCGEERAPAKPETAAEAANAQKAGRDAAASDLIAQAQGLYDETNELIGKSDFKTAQQDVDQLNAIKPRLPTDWQTKIDEVAKKVAARGK